MNQTNKRHFSLLEVLIALMLITASLPLLLTPFIYATADQQETVQKLRKEKTSLYYLVTILENLHTGSIPLNQLDGTQEYPFRPEWKGEDWKTLPITGTYKFKKIKDKKGNEGQQIELWELIIDIKDSTTKEPTTSSLSYEFIVRRAKSADETAKQDEAIDEE